MAPPSPFRVLLPIDPLLPEITDHLRRHTTLVLEAPPGAGKTTRVPAALLDLDNKDVLVLEPRRLAARLAARFIARERGEPLGSTVGYQVRFEEVAGAETRLRFLTEGVLTRRLLSDPLLEGAGTVVLDEFHERHLEGDLALALLRRLQQTRRPDLRLLAMSATLDAGPIARYLGDSVVLRSEGRQYPLAIEYTPHSAAPLEGLVATALERLAGAGLDGHVLVFLPGAAEIRRAMTACEPVARRRDLLLVSLHGDQTPEEQDRAVLPSEKTKVILSTNVAESSVTIEGVTAVIDSGLARIAGHSPWTGLPTLKVSRTSQASANQRAGRAGRTAPGRAVRLYPLEDFVRRPAHDLPEIVRADLAPAALQLRGMRVAGFNALDWLDAPPPENISAAEDLLRRLHAVDAEGALTKEGRAMTRYPLHPRLSRLVLEAVGRGVGEDACWFAAELTSDDSRAARQILRVVNPPRQQGHDEQALAISILTAFPDRVARRRQARELQLAGGGAAMLAPGCDCDADFLVAVEIEDRKDQKLPLVRLARPIEPAWLLDLFPERIAERTEIQWNRAAGRVESWSALLYDNLVIEESRGMPDPEAAAAMLAGKALELGLERLTSVEALHAFRARAEFAGMPVADDTIRRAIAGMAQGLRSLDDLKSHLEGEGLVRALERGLGAATRRQIEETAPSHIRLPGGRQVKVHYEAGKTPWIESRLQDFFGMRDTPRIGAAKVPVVVHLLAPNHRPVQMTTDLAGFWERLYPTVRRELMRRYPKHAWPETPR
jgi:ATP-dependent helicase HrpB